MLICFPFREDQGSPVSSKPAVYQRASEGGVVPFFAIPPASNIPVVTRKPKFLYVLVLGSSFVKQEQCRLELQAPFVYEYSMSNVHCSRAWNLHRGRREKRKFELSHAIDPVEQTEEVYIDVRAAEGCLELRHLFLEHFVVVALVGLPAYLRIAAED